MVLASYQVKSSPTLLSQKDASNPMSMLEVRSGFRSSFPGLSNCGAAFPRKEMELKVRSLSKGPGGRPVSP